jgi:hypothetical protein
LVKVVEQPPVDWVECRDSNRQYRGGVLALRAHTGWTHAIYGKAPETCDLTIRHGASDERRFEEGDRRLYTMNQDFMSSPVLMADRNAYHAGAKWPKTVFFAPKWPKIGVVISKATSMRQGVTLGFHGLDEVQRVPA